MIKEHIKEGKIVPMEVTIKLLENAMRAAMSSEAGEGKEATKQATIPARRFLIDGFPRQMDQAIKFDESVSLLALGAAVSSGDFHRTRDGAAGCDGFFPRVQIPLTRWFLVYFPFPAGLPVETRPVPRLPRTHPPRAIARTRQDVGSR